LKSSLSDDNKTTKEETPNLKPKKDIIKHSEDKEKIPAKKTTQKKNKIKSDTTKKNWDELWHDWMDIPDWLSDDKKKDDK